MRPKTDRLAIAIAIGTMALPACGPPEPSAIFLHTVESGLTTRAEPPTKIAEGDLFVIDANPQNGDESMDLCIDATVSGSSAVRVARVRGQCRRFVVIASGAGTARVRFEARGTASELVLDVTSAR
jgi:hypothetical protein